MNQTDEGRRRYLTTTVRVRLHQRSFRERVLDAYQEQCACCRLKHLELLDAAHIVGGRLGIRPDYVIEINKGVMEGPVICIRIQGGWRRGMGSLGRIKESLDTHTSVWYKELASIDHQ